MEENRAVLETRNLGITFGGLKALEGVHFRLHEKEIIGLIGPNGAGKTTVFNLLTDVYYPTDGEIELEGNSIVGKKTYQITQNGIARTFQNIRLFKDVTVLDNVKTAMTSKMKYSLLSSIFRLPAYRREEKEISEKPMRCLRCSASMRKPMKWHGTSPMANSASWRSPVRWQPLQRFCCWMNRLRHEPNRDERAYGNDSPDSG